MEFSWLSGFAVPSLVQNIISQRVLVTGILTQLPAVIVLQGMCRKSNKKSQLLDSKQLTGNSEFL